MFIRRNVEDNRVKVYNVDAIYVISLSLLAFFKFHDVKTVFFPLRSNMAMD